MEIGSTRRCAYQASTEQAGTGALLLTHNAAAADAVVDELVLLGETLTGVSTWEQDRQLVLSFFVVQINKLVFLFGWGAGSTLLSLRKHPNWKKETVKFQDVALRFHYQITRNTNSCEIVRITTCSPSSDQWEFWQLLALVPPGSQLTLPVCYGPSV